MLPLQAQLSHISSEIEDILHATKLNLQALAVRLESSPSISNQKVNSCVSLIDAIKEKIKERQKCRLEYLISQQIRDQQGKVRRQRLAEYEQKIQDQRRLVSDKEGFYQSLLRPRKKKPANLTAQEWLDLRRGELRKQQANNLSKLQEQANDMRKIERKIKEENEALQCWIKQAEDGLNTHEIEEATNLIERNPCLYDFVSLPEFPKPPTAIKCELPEKCNQLIQKYNEERELMKYLQWENAKLKSEYGDETAKGKNKQPIKMCSKKRFVKAISL